jgi:predicted amidophosphoribosyltransferase
MTARWWTDGDRIIEADGEECAVVRVFGEHIAISCDLEVIATGLEAATCSLCGGHVPRNASLPICARCESTAKAHARLEQSRIDYERDVLEARGIL